MLSDFIIKGKLSKIELKTLRRDINIYSVDAQKAGVSGYRNKGFDEEEVRKGVVCFPKVHKFPKTFSIIQSAIIETYSDVLKTDIDLSDIAEIQYAKYEKGCFFKKHSDTIKDGYKPRLLTFSINITDETEYSGGDLVLYDGNRIIDKLDKESGSFIIFPSFFMHEAKKVTEGTREAIVTWIHTDHRIFNNVKREIYYG